MKYVLSLVAVILLMSCSSKLAEDEYYQKAKEAYGNQKFTEAVENFKGLVDNYPESKYRAEALFLLGFINANDIKDLEQAKIYYEKFIAEFPDHDLTDDAEYELKTLGKDINELPIFKDAEADSAAETALK
jgi:outer membrane protein assembly factor BamD (BamD/ComL family)